MLLTFVYAIPMFAFAGHASDGQDYISPLRNRVTSLENRMNQVINFVNHQNDIIGDLQKRIGSTAPLNKKL